MGRRTPTRSGEARWEEIIRSSRVAHRPPPRRRGRRIVLYGSLLLLSLTVLGAGTFTYVGMKFDQIDIKALESRATNEPMNVLVLGSDSRAALPEQELEKFDPTGKDRGTGRRADTIILVHLDENRNQAVLIHFPRDLRVRYPEGNLGKINGTYQKGPDTVIKTVENFTGLPIHHYVEVNFVGFRNIVTSLGGVNVYFEKPIKEPDSGLNVPAGCVKLTGDQALAFVRVRKIDDDFGRIQRQQLFLSLMMDKVTSAGTLLNPRKMLRLVDSISDNLTTDADISPRDMQKLAWRLRSFDPKRVDMRVVPSAGARIRGVSYVISNDRQTQSLFQAIKDRKPLPDYGRTGVSPIDPADVRITVMNGTNNKGLGAKALEELRSKGYQLIEPAINAERADHSKTVVYWKEGSEEKARLVAAHYGAQSKPLPAGSSLEDLVEGDVALVLGQDFADDKATPPPPPAPAKGKSGTPPKPLIHACEK